MFLSVLLGTGNILKALILPRKAKWQNERGVSHILRQLAFRQYRSFIGQCQHRSIIPLSRCFCLNVMSVEDLLQLFWQTQKKESESEHGYARID